jgi:hypothetical protein
VLSASCKITRLTDLLNTKVDTHALPTNQGAYAAIHETPKDATIKYSVEDLLKMGFTLVKWDGM